MPHTGLNATIYLILLLALMPDVHLGGISCAFRDDASYSVGVNLSQFGDITEPGKMHCNESESKCCMGIWVISNGEIQHTVLGCFPKKEKCRCEICLPHYRQGTYQCFCSSDMCNANISFLRQHISSELEHSAHWNSSCDWMNATREQPWNANRSRNHVAVLVAIINFFLLLSILGFILVRKENHCLLDRGEGLLEDEEVLLEERSCPPLRPVEGLALLQVLREDSLAVNLWFGNLYGKGVIIKGFPPPKKNLYHQEWKILNLLTPLQHENIVCLLAAGSGNEGLLQDHQLLVFPHYPQGSLRKYLTDRTIDWDTACCMAISIARGLAFLHTDLWNGDICKPAIAHRDLSSDNVLVTEDSSCVITDFGLSVVLENCQTKKNPRDPAILNMTGTLRYMSPEMLDGSLNLKSWKKALTQADVYSLGLLMWEIFSRCNDLYADHQCPEFRVAYTDELGPNPTLNDLQYLVVENKQRPLPINWRKNLQLFKALWETLEDCWDPDSEARLTAQCAEQRLRNLLSAPFSLLPGNGI
ncbi:anti-Muellerian hormone type-2 receptor isoform X1 [Ranitomeya variabilis]|uniref:anti-Muellerian hormone type-2 receptor isoform X1 n=1 Tax=Ranitomeya variabilis TaxID=490064 RepID=UPI004056C42C